MSHLLSESVHSIGQPHPHLIPSRGGPQFCSADHGQKSESAKEEREGLTTRARYSVRRRLERAAVALRPQPSGTRVGSHQGSKDEYFWLF
jgi:hypothetical protein